MVKRTTDPNSLFLIFCGLMKSLRVLDQHLAEGKRRSPDHNIINIGVFPVMSMTAALGAELTLKYAYECDHCEAFPILKGVKGHNLKELYERQKVSRQIDINRFYRKRFEELKLQNVRIVVSLSPPERAEAKEYRSAQDVVDNEGDVFVRARYLAEVFEISPGIVCKYKVDTNPYHLWALALGVSDTIDWRKLTRSDNIVISTDL